MLRLSTLMKTAVHIEPSVVMIEIQMHFGQDNNWMIALFKSSIKCKNVNYCMAIPI